MIVAVNVLASVHMFPSLESDQVERKMEKFQDFFTCGDWGYLVVGTVSTTIRLSSI
jgi:hypothetical protein